jgi:hypothetical protein
VFLGVARLSSRRLRALINYSVVLRVRAYPKPEIATFDFNGESPIAKSDADRPIASHLFELQRWVAWISPK